jgi:hypothetical protein
MQETDGPNGTIPTNCLERRGKLFGSTVIAMYGLLEKSDAQLETRKRPWAWGDVPGVGYTSSRSSALPLDTFFKM